VVETYQKIGFDHGKYPLVIPIGSMYGIYADMWGILMVKYGK